MPTYDLGSITADNFYLSIRDDNSTTETLSRLRGWYEGTLTTNDCTSQINDDLTGYIEHKSNLGSVITSSSVSYTGLTSTNVPGCTATWTSWYPVNTYDWSVYIDGIESDYEKCTSFRFRTRRKRLCLKFKI